MPAEPSPQLALDIGLDVEARFETFYVGPNGATVAALRDPPRPGVWLAGARGSGRSHLLQAAAAERAPGRAFYLPLRVGLPAAITEGLARDALVCIDDIECIAGADDWERALLLLYERLLAGGGRLVVSAPARPVDAGLSLADLESRLSSLTHFRLRPPDDEGRYEALMMRASARGLRLPDDTARYLLLRLARGGAPPHGAVRARRAAGRGRLSVSRRRRAAAPAACGPPG